MKKWIHASERRNNAGQTFNEWLEDVFYKGFDPSGLSDDEYYELEDAFYEERPIEMIDTSGISEEEFNEWWSTLSSKEMDLVMDLAEDHGLDDPGVNWSDQDREFLKAEFEQKYR